MSAFSKACAHWCAVLTAAALSTTALSGTAMGQAASQTSNTAGSLGAVASQGQPSSQGPSSQRWQLLMHRYANAGAGAASPNAARTAAAEALHGTTKDTTAHAAPATGIAGLDAVLANDVQPLRFERHFPVPASRMLLSGEHATLKIPVHVPRTEATRTTHLKVGAITSVAALSDVSSLDVYLNGILMGTMEPRYDAPREAWFPVTPGQLVEGFNEVMFLARQQHRIECTIDGTYELWTRVIPELTAFVGDGPSSDRPALSNLQSVLGRSAAPSTLKVDLSAINTPAEVSELLRLVNAIILHGHIADPRIVPATSRSPGTYIAISDDMRGTLARPGAALFEDASNLVLVPTGADGATIVLTGNDAEVAETLDRLETSVPDRPTVGSERGLEAFDAAFLRELDEATSITFAELGIESHEFTGRNYILEFGLRLPGDFYEADYGSVLLYLDSSYAGNFLNDTKLSVEVNGAEAVTLNLSEKARGSLKRKELRIPLTFFHGGLNTVSLNAELLTPSDLSCAPEHAPVSQPRFAIADTSRIVVPGMARVGVAPNLAATLSNGYPYTLDDTPTPVHLIGERSSALGTALSLFGAMTASARTVETYDVSFAVPDRNVEGFVIGTSDGMPAWAAEMIGMPTKKPPADAEPDGGGLVLEDNASEFDSAATIEAGAFAASLPNPFGGETAGFNRPNLLDDADPIALHDFLAEHVSPTIADTIATLIGGSKTVIKERVFNPGEVVLTQRAVSGATGLNAVSDAVLRGEPPRTVTVVAADGPEVLAARLARDDTSWPRFDASGQYYAIGVDETRTIAAGGDGILYATQPPGLMNLRYVAAGWLATNYRFYVALVSGALVVFGFLTWRATRSWQSQHVSGDRDAH